jgi:predicted acyl esterase
LHVDFAPRGHSSHLLCCLHSRTSLAGAGGSKGFASPKYDEYTADPAKPVPYRQRPTLFSDAPDATWGEWLVDDQRFAASRPDVLVYETEPLKEPLRVAGQPIANLFASTTGTDLDWVVKIIDVWPDEDPNHPKMGGYQQMLSADILRGRFREDPSRAKPIAAGKTLIRRRSCRTSCLQSRRRS